MSAAAAILAALVVAGCVSTAGDNSPVTITLDRQIDLSIDKSAPVRSDSGVGK